MMDLVFALAPGGARRVAFGLDAAAPSVFSLSSLTDAASLAQSGLKALPEQAAVALLGPEKVAEIKALGAKTVVYLESARTSYTEAELVQAKRGVRLYDLILERVTSLERFERSGVPLSSNAKGVLASCKQYLAAMAQPVGLAKQALGSQNKGAFGVVTEAVTVAAGWTVGEIVLVIIVVSVVAAIIAVSAYYAWSYHNYSEASKATDETIQASLALANNPEAPPELRAQAMDLAIEAEKNRPQPPPDPLAGLTNLLWAGGAIIGLGVLAYVAAPFLSELGKTGASELGAVREGRERSRLARIGQDEAAGHGHGEDAWFDADGRPMLLEGGS